MQIYDFLLEQSCISRCLTLVASQISNFIADTNHFLGSVENHREGTIILEFLPHVFPTELYFP